MGFSVCSPLFFDTKQRKEERTAQWMAIDMKDITNDMNIERLEGKEEEKWTMEREYLKELLQHISNVLYTVKFCKNTT